MSVCSTSVFSETVLSGASNNSRERLPKNSGGGRRDQLTPNQIKAWDAAAGQAVLLPNVVSTTADDAADSKIVRVTTRGKKSDKEKSKNAPSEITVLGVVDQFYHTPSSDLTAQQHAQKQLLVSKPTLSRINKARSHGKATPVKLHHQQLDDAEDNYYYNEEDDTHLNAVSSGGGGASDSISLILPPKDFIKEYISNGPVESKYKRLKEELDFSGVKIRSKERELVILKEMREIKKKQKKLSKVAVQDTLLLNYQSVKNVVPAVNNANNITAKQQYTSSGISPKDGAGGAARKNEKRLDRLTTGVDVARDRNKLTEGREMSLMTQRLAQNGETYIALMDHKKQYPGTRVFQSPYGHTLPTNTTAAAGPTAGSEPCSLQRHLLPTTLPCGSDIVKTFVSRQGAQDVVVNKGMNLTGAPGPLLEHQRRLVGGTGKWDG